MSSLHKVVFFFNLQRIHHHVPSISCSRPLRQLSSSIQQSYLLSSNQRTILGCQTPSNCHSRTAFGFRTSLNYFCTSGLRIEHLKYSGHGRNGYGVARLFSEQQQHRNQQQDQWKSSSQQRTNNRNTLMYVVAIAIAVTGLSYAAVPLYRIFCQATGYGGTVIKVDAGDKIEAMNPIEERELTIRFNADTSSAMRWHFKPQQQEIKIVPGETALAFYTARNPTDKPVTGIATYNVIPFEAGLYFNKIQCFCFEEQRLNPHEQVDMPVFFYIDPEFDEDPAMAKVDTITLSYTFFESKEGEELPQPFTPAPA